MKKTKLAICMKDLEYQDRFVNCFLNHYKHLYELHVFTNLDQLNNSMPREYAVMITGEYSTEEMAGFVERGEILFYLEEYQEVYKIAEKIGCLVAENEQKNSAAGGCVQYQKTGIYSLSQEQYQMPFAVLLSRIYGEKQKVLILDLQGYSGLRDTDGDNGRMGLEDLLTVVMTGNYSRGRLQECIHQEAGFAYVTPVQNTQCLAEGSQERFTALMDLLAKEFGYERFIVNFGTVFSGQTEMMQQCESLFLLTKNELDADWREKSFYAEVKNLEGRNILSSIKKIVPSSPAKAETDWKALVEHWCWGTMGAMVRKLVEEGTVDGTDM